ncbi:hypothetical protein FRC12_024628 [Ceratobasidium sp. 428]|nr:hypothetical protein FRC12_024628 [Ceratobasidium sp. 428]
MEEAHAKAQPPPASTEVNRSDDSKSDDEVPHRVTKAITQTAALLQAPKKRTADKKATEEESTFEAEALSTVIISIYTTNYNSLQPTEEEPPAKKWKIKSKMRPLPEPDLVTPAPLPPSGGTIDTSSSDPPVTSSSKHPDAISLSDAVGTEDTKSGLRVVSAKKAKVVVPSMVNARSRRRQQ